MKSPETSASQILVAKLQHANSGPEIPEADFKQMLNKLGYSPSPAILAEALELPSDSTGDGQSDIYGILGILRFLRDFRLVKKLRQSAGLSDQQVAKIRSKFGLKLEAGKRVEPQEFELGPRVWGPSFRAP
eukprot:s585_g7.t1